MKHSLLNFILLVLTPAIAYSLYHVTDLTDFIVRLVLLFLIIYPTTNNEITASMYGLYFGFVVLLVPIFGLGSIYSALLLIGLVTTIILFSIKFKRRIRFWKKKRINQ